MGKPTATHLFEANHQGVDSPDDPNLFSMAEMGCTPVVADSAARDALFPTPVGDEKVRNKASGNDERYDATKGYWVADVQKVLGVQRFGAKCNDSADDTSAVQAAIDEATALPGGGNVVFPPGTISRVNNLQNKAGVTLVGSFSGRPGAGLRLNAAGTIVDSPAGQLHSHMGVVGLNLIGLGAGTAGSGVRIRQGYWGSISRNFFQNFADQAIILDATSTAIWVTENIGYNILLNRSRAAVIGCVDVDGADHIITDCEFTASTSAEGAIISANLYIAAYNVKSANHFFSNLVGEISDVGFHIAGSGLNRFANCRADLNYGPGFRITSGGNSFASCMALRNSQTTDNTYSGFQLDAATAQGNVFAGCYSGGLAADAKQQKYGFEDNGTYAATLSRNTYVGCSGQNNRTRTFFMTASSTASGVEMPPHLIVAANADATPDVANTSVVTLGSYSSTTTITNFANGTNGQTLWVLGDNDVTIQHNGSTIVTNSGANIVVRDSVIYCFKNVNGIWRQLASDQNLINQAIAYSASMTPNASLGQQQTITATDGAAFTINTPTKPMNGAVLKIRIRNTSGGALGVATWGAGFKMGAAWTQPATAFSRSIQFTYDNTNWVEDWRSAADIAN